MPPKRTFIKRTLCFLLIVFFQKTWTQHLNKINAKLNFSEKTIAIEQEITFTNTSHRPLTRVILNDWNHAYSAKNTPLAKRFSDEFVRSFHIASNQDRGMSLQIQAFTLQNTALEISRPSFHPDLLEIQLPTTLENNQKFTFLIRYTTKIPHERFTRYGFNDSSILLKNWFLSIARLDEKGFTQYSNENLDDIANAKCNYEVVFETDKKLHLVTDLNILSKTDTEKKTIYTLNGRNRLDFAIAIETKPSFVSYKNSATEIVTNLKDKRLNVIEKSLVTDRVTHYVSQELGPLPQEKILLSQADYERNPFYGLNQLPAFISPFPDSFIYEIKLLKIYIDKYLKYTLQLNPRKDTWIYDGFQTYLFMKYIREKYPDMKMMGNLSSIGILKGYHIFSADFNDQFRYLYLFMARKNLDQAIGDDKTTFLKFNEQIAGKYRAGLSFNYLDNFLKNEIVSSEIKNFIALNQIQPTDESDFEVMLKSKTTKNIDWFFKKIIDSRELIDFKISKIKKNKSTFEITIKNKTHTKVPVSLYAVKNDSVVYQKWFDNIVNDSTVVLPKIDAEKFVLNYHNEIPEFNARNNWKSLHSFLGNNRPFRFTFIKDLENSKANQIFFVPELSYNFYDGVSPGLSFHNKSFLNKPFIFDVTPIYSSKTNGLIGGAFFTYNQYIREDQLYYIRYSLGGATYHYAPNAAYTKITPSIAFYFRDLNYRSNKKEMVVLRHIIVNREKTPLVTQKDLSYSIFNLRYTKGENEITRLYNIVADAQVATKFGKLAGEIQYRKLFDNNQQINLRYYMGFFMYRSTNSGFFDFGLDRPTDYLFDYGLLGRSESSGIFSQQFILAEGGFKSKLDTRYANQWITTLNASCNIWNWIELYGDAGFLKNTLASPKFIYDSGIRLNLVPDYFELYFPVYSKNGWEITPNNYNEKIRFVITLSPKTLISLFTRKWF